MMFLIKAGDSHADVQWLLYLQDHGCYCMNKQASPLHRCSEVTISARSWLLLYEQTSVTLLHRCLVVTNCMVLDGL